MSKQVIEIILKIYLLKGICCIFIYIKYVGGKVPRSSGQSSLLGIKHIGMEVIPYVTAFNDLVSVVDMES